MNAPTDDDRPFGRGPQGRWYQRSDGSEDHRRIKRLRRDLIEARPDGAEAPGEALSLVVSGSGEGIDSLPLVSGNLGNDVSRGPEAVNSQTLPPLPRHPVGAIADEAGAQKRSGLRIAEGLRNLEAVPVVGYGVFGVAAIPGIAGEKGCIAQVFLSLPAVRAGTAGPSEPGYPHPVADPETGDPLADLRDGPDDFMTENEGKLGLASSPSTICRSVRQTPHTPTLIKSSSGEGIGTGIVRISRGRPGSWNTMARIFSAISISFLRR